MRRGADQLPFRDRAQAGRELAAALTAAEVSVDVVIGLPRGGVPVAAEVAAALGAELDVCLVRKIGAPWQPELAVGALAEGCEPLIDRGAIAELGISERELEEAISRERSELSRRLDLYRGGRAPIDVSDRDVAVVDDGVATGATAVAAARALRARGARRVIAAMPVCPPGSGRTLGGDFDQVLCLHEPPGFRSVGTWYEDFRPTGDDEVVSLLSNAR